VILAALAGLRHVPLSAIGIFLYLPILLLFAQGIAWIVSGLQVFVRDTIQVLQIVIAVWFWLTPVMYGANRLKDFAQIAILSPVAVSVTVYRQSLLGLSQPPAMQVALAAAISLAVFFVGALFFRRTKPAFADVL
jgi:lipopolysaccharide transport system permease protein